MNRKLPDYLLEKRHQIVTIIATVVITVGFLSIYVPLSSTAWFKLSGAVSFFLTVGCVALAILILVICRMLMCRLRRRQQFRSWSYVLWMLAEALVITLFYSYVTHTLMKADLVVGNFPFVTLFSNGLIVVIAILIISNTIAILWSIQRDQKERLRLLSAGLQKSVHGPVFVYGKPTYAGEEISTVGDVAAQKKNASESSPDDDLSTATHPESEPRIINLYDHNGILRFSIKESDLYYIISQDNYVRIHYLSNGEMSSYMLRCPLKVIEKSLKGSSLIRCHRSYMVNIARIKVLRSEREGFFIDLDYDGTAEIPISKSYSDTFMEHFSKKVAGKESNEIINKR
jgi:hypothetical protein